MTSKKEVMEKLQNMLQAEENSESLNLQNFFNDMDMLGKQVHDKSIKKPTFFYGDASVTNYLLWLILGELKILKNKT